MRLGVCKKFVNAVFLSQSEMRVDNKVCLNLKTSGCKLIK